MLPNPLIFSFHDHSNPSFPAVTIARGNGVYVFDTEGREYLEGMSGLWNAPLGFSDPELCDAIQEQARTLPTYHTTAGRCADVTLRLADHLLSKAPGDYKSVYFSNSGTEANETALKLLLYRRHMAGIENPVFLSRERAYHGSTMGAASLNGISSTRNGLGLPVLNVRYASCPSHAHTDFTAETDADLIDCLITEIQELIETEGPEQIAGMFLEPVLGAGGVIVPPASYYPRLLQVLQSHAIPVVADEVICGIGRLARLWGGPRLGLTGHLMTCAKGLGSGFCPIGATLLDEEMTQVLKEHNAQYSGFPHGYTFSGQPIAAAAALTTLHLIDKRQLIEHAQAMEPLLSEAVHSLKSFDIVTEVRGLGLLYALEIGIPDGWSARGTNQTALGTLVADAAEQEGLFVRGLGNSVVICPPIIISAEEINELSDRLRHALKAIQSRLEYA